MMQLDPVNVSHSGTFAGPVRVSTRVPVGLPYMERDSRRSAVLAHVELDVNAGYGVTGVIVEPAVNPCALNKAGNVGVEVFIRGDRP